MSSTSRLYLVLKPIQIPRLALVGLCRYAQNESAAAGRDLIGTVHHGRCCGYPRVYIRYCTAAHVPVLSRALAPKRPGASHSSAGENWKWKRQISPSHDAASFFSHDEQISPRQPQTQHRLSGPRNRSSRTRSSSPIASLDPPLAALEDDSRPPPCPLTLLDLRIGARYRCASPSNRNHAYVTESGT